MKNIETLFLTSCLAILGFLGPFDAQAQQDEQTQDRYPFTRKEMPDFHFNIGILRNSDPNFSNLKINLNPEFQRVISEGFISSIPPLADDPQGSYRIFFRHGNTDFILAAKEINGDMILSRDEVFSITSVGPQADGCQNQGIHVGRVSKSQTYVDTDCRGEMIVLTNPVDPTEEQVLYGMVGESLEKLYDESFEEVVRKKFGFRID